MNILAQKYNDHGLVVNELYALQYKELFLVKIVPGIVYYFKEDINSFFNVQNDKLVDNLLIGNFWTLVKYDGNGILEDLITGIRFYYKTEDVSVFIGPRHQEEVSRFSENGLDIFCSSFGHIHEISNDILNMINVETIPNFYFIRKNIAIYENLGRIRTRHNYLYALECEMRYIADIAYRENEIRDINSSFVKKKKI